MVPDDFVYSAAHHREGSKAIMDVSDDPQQILFFTAPTAVTFHVALAEELAKTYPGIPVKFVSLYSLAIRRVRAMGWDAVYFADVLKKVTGDELDTEAYCALDKRLYDHSGANINLMLMADKTLPRHGRKAEALTRRYVVAVERLVTPRTLSIARMHDCFLLWLASAMTTAKAGWYFGFVSNAIPANSALALRSPLDTWSVATSAAHPPDSLGDARHELSRPPEERMHYMRSTRPEKILPAIREQIITFVSLLRDAQSGSGAVLYRYAWNFMTIKWRMYAPRIPSGAVDYHSVADVNAEPAPFCFFPLQVEPEASIMSFSPWFRDQFEAARLVSQAVPVGWKVLVKEHPSMVRHRSRRFLRRLQQLPNVRLVAPTISSHDMITRSHFVFCITGTATFEAKILGKPAYCMGRPAFSPMLDGCDVARDSFLGDFFERILRADNRALSEEAFQNYTRATLHADACTRSVEGVWQHDDSSDNVGRFARYIEAAVSGGA